MKVLTHISGSTVVVMFDDGDYIEARTIHGADWANRIEVVKSGRVVEDLRVQKTNAPECIIDLLKTHFPFRCRAGSKGT